MAALSEEAVSPLLPNASHSSSQRRRWKKILVEREDNVHAIRKWHHIFHDERQICVAWRDPGLVSSASRLVESAGRGGWGSQGTLPAALPLVPKW